MTPNQAKIVVTNPCTENWNSMSADPAGRFCQSCQKSVIDFSSKTDDEIKGFLKEKRGEKLCGRFYTHQLERIRIEIDRNLLVSDIPFWQKFLIVLLVCLGPDLMGYDFVFAQSELDSMVVKTEHVDSLPAKPDTTLAASELIPDSLQAPLAIKIPEIGQICTVDPDLFVTGMMILGSVTTVDEEFLNPEWRTPLVIHQPKTDTAVSEEGLVQVSKKKPAAPKRPEKKPIFPQHVLIADAGERKKTRRS